MQLSVGNTGVIIAYVIPGTVVMLGLSYFSQSIQRWLGTSGNETPNFGGALLFVLMALGAGLIADAIRSQTIDEVHHQTGVVQPVWSYSQLDKDKFELFQGIVENHFRYHQFYGNTFLSLLFAYVAKQISTKSWPWRSAWRTIGLVVLLVVLWVGSRSDLDASYRAIDQLLNAAK